MARWRGSRAVRDAALAAWVVLAHGLDCAPPTREPPLFRLVAHDYLFAAPVHAAFGLHRMMREVDVR
jgi:hypothetical protein